MQGVIGDTYERFTVGQEAFNPNSTYWLPEDVRPRPLESVPLGGSLCLYLGGNEAA